MVVIVVVIAVESIIDVGDIVVVVAAVFRVNTRRPSQKYKTCE